MNDFILSEIKNLLLEQNDMLKIFTPNEVSLSHICILTGKSRQTVRDYLINNFEPEVHFFKKNGRIILTRDTAVQIIRTYNAKQR